MNNKEKAPTSAVTLTRAKVEGSACINYNMGANGCQRISDLLRHGGINATPCRDLVALTGWRPRQVTRAIEAERRQGMPIAANGKGYFLPANDFELDRYLNSLQHRELEVKKTRIAVAQTRQQRMDLVGGDS